MRRSLTAAVVQLCSRQEVTENLRRCEALVAQAAARGAELVVLPENFAYIGQLSTKLKLAEPLDAERPGPILGAMRALAQREKVHLLLGGTPTSTDDPARFRNTAILLSPEGKLLAAYHKLHLFDVNIPDGAVFRESEHVAPGEELATTEVLGATLGLSICYDLRFPELYRELVRRGATVVCVPAAFTLHTGKDHWLPLLRARAIENQVYVLAAGQYGRHTESRASYGKSCIIDPWGAVVAQASDAEGIAVAELDLDYLAKVRRELPCLGHRRL
ncbi:MAG: carbon-nitrogen hydrolase family protein [Deltaproteobacteria bacterium]|nr:carbon-nitrogen hydrolase family protein [Deltaproteobacteria bacterium]